MDYMILLNYSMSNDRSHGGNPRFGNNCDNNNIIIIMDIKKNSKYCNSGFLHGLNLCE